MLLLIASQQSQLHALLAAMVFGLIVGVFGHTFRVPLATGIAHMIVGYLLALGAA